MNLNAKSSAFENPQGKSCREEGFSWIQEMPLLYCRNFGTGFTKPCPPLPPKTRPTGS
jgi:hypothetical protein